MPLTKIQQTIWEKAKALGSGGQATALTNEACAYLVGRIVVDLDLQEDFPELESKAGDFFTSGDLSKLVIENTNATELFARLVSLRPDADMYFACLAALHKSRLKYEKILQTQPIPSLEQVGPRGLLQHGQLSPKALSGLLFWRKWLFDIDNRAGQETGYLFEPIIAYAIGGTPVPAGKSPVKRHKDNRKGRQVDCLLKDKAYELKIRVTIAASGQGRWREELDYPIDCQKSGYKPVLVVLDGTPNPKLSELEAAFLGQNGEVYKGKDAWDHLDDLAGETMSRFLDNYVRGPIAKIIEETECHLLSMTLTQTKTHINIQIGSETLHIERAEEAIGQDTHDESPPDAEDNIPG